jgi:multicomponent Na+:H+ antiporter subunit F
MTVALWTAAAGVLATIALGLLRVERGPSNGDRMLAAQLLGTGAVTVLLLVARAADAPALLDVALVLALLASVAGAVFVRRIGVRPRGSGADRTAEDGP